MAALIIGSPRVEAPVGSDEAVVVGRVEVALLLAGSGGRRAGVAVIGEEAVVFAPSAVVGAPECGFATAPVGGQHLQAARPAASPGVVSNPGQVAVMGFLANVGVGYLEAVAAGSRVSGVSAPGDKCQWPGGCVADLGDQFGDLRFAVPALAQQRPAVADDLVVLGVLHGCHLRFGFGPVDNHGHPLPVGFVVLAGDAGDDKAGAAEGATAEGHRVIWEVPPVVEVEKFPVVTLDADRVDVDRGSRPGESACAARHFHRAGGRSARGWHTGLSVPR